MSYAAFKMIHEPTGVDNCGVGYITLCRPPATAVAAATSSSMAVLSDTAPLQDEGIVPAALAAPSKWSLPLPNLVITKSNVLELYTLRIQEDTKRALPQTSPALKRVLGGLSGAYLELTCHYRLHGNVESLSILSPGSDDGRKKRDAIILSFRGAKISVLEFDDAINGLRVSSMHCFEGPEWQYLKRGREKFAKGPLVRSDPQGRCAGVLIYDSQMIILKASQAGYGLGEDETFNIGGTVSMHIESSYIANLHDMEMKHVKDFVFINGYIEPVLVVLHEKEPTWAGMLAWKHHTCTISALSVSMTLKQHPLIWSATNLPHDAYRLLAVPSPLGGVVVICANSLHYYSQSASFTLALNDFARTVDGRSETPRSNIDIELDLAHATWISNDTALFSAKTGLLLQLYLVNDGRTVQKLDLIASRSSTLASCICTIGDSFFFLGSRLGDSLLVQFSCGTGTTNLLKSSKDEVGDFEGEFPATKRLRRASSDISQDITSGDEIAPYNLTSTIPDPSQYKPLGFTIRDVLLNVGPLRDFAYGLRTNAEVKETGAAKQKHYELVACSGHGKNGSLCVFQQYIRPEQSTEVELEGCKGAWTVYHRSSQGNNADSSELKTEGSKYHAYIIFSFDSQTRILESADTIGEISVSADFFIKGPTVAAGNLFSRRRIIQIYAQGLRLLDGQYMTQELLLGDAAVGSDSGTVSAASIVDPYALLQMADGSLQLVVGDPATSTVSISVVPICQSSADSITACTLYLDRGPEPWMQKTSTDAWISTVAAAQDDIYCIIARQSGRLDIYEVPGFSCVFSVDNFPSGKSILSDTCLPDVSSNIHQKMEPDHVEGQKNGKSLLVTELCMLKWNDHHGRPFIFAILSDGTVLCYHAFFYSGQDNVVKTELGSNCEGTVTDTATARLRNLRFLRVALDSLTREETESTSSGKRLATFRNVAGCQGVFLSGKRPAWLMVFRERIRVHPQLCDGAILAFAPFHNINCKHGFLYITAQGFLKICQLPQINYDSCWPFAKIPLKGTPHQITYSSQLNLYAFSISSPVSRPINQVLPSSFDQDSMHPTDLDNSTSEDAQKLYTVEEFEVRIVASAKAVGNWETKKGSVTLHTTETVIALRMVTVMNTAIADYETLLAIGTAYVQGEDVAARGRIILVSIRPDQENSSNWASEVYSKELKGAISAIASIQGHLLIASGPKIILYQWNGQDMNGFAFYDAPHYVVSLNIVKNFVLLGDIHKSIYFLLWKEEGAQLSLLAKDFGSLNCYATEFLIDDATLSLVVSDDQQNIEIFSYAPKSSESWKGQKLLPRAEFHVGAHVSKFLRLQMLPTSISDRNNPYALLCGTLNGSIGCIAPLDEVTFKRLQFLQSKLVDAIPHSCGLNPRAFRKFRSNGRPHRPGPDNIVDCELLRHYEMLPLEQQLEIAQQMASTRSQILINLNDFNVCISFL